jgi:hypothetical protein
MRRRTLQANKLVLVVLFENRGLCVPAGLFKGKYLLPKTAAVHRTLRAAAITPEVDLGVERIA